MKVIHTTMISCGSRIPTVYGAQVVDCRWTNNKAAGRWSAKVIRDTGDRLTFPENDRLHSSEHRAACDKLSREVAARLGLPAGPDMFPFAGGEIRIADANEAHAIALQELETADGLHQIADMPGEDTREPEDVANV